MDSNQVYFLLRSFADSLVFRLCSEIRVIGLEMASRADRCTICKNES